ncbi:MAG TPA: NAD-dependent succinate-semialdehyde dehydrogenase [Candidatus Kryptonia bacterium]|nr:NAD-dependent succinate-semialdehyde dehydrogenase [Candidatus Kryptonia bacterium]
MAIESINPASGTVVRRFRPQPRAAIEAALSRAARAYASWRTTTLAVRGALMQRAGTVLRERAPHFAALITLEMGKPITQAIAEIEKCAWACDYFGEHAATLLADEVIDTGTRSSAVQFAPLGVVLAVMPWNFPFWQVFRFAAPTLMAGNVGVLKHASNVPQCALAIADVFRRAGFPDGVFATLLIESRAVARVIADERIAAVTLTGSEAAGIEVATAAGRNLKKVVLELGGSDPFIVLRDADLDRCCTVAAQARTVNSGQSCIAAKRFIVERAIAKPFLSRFVEHMAMLRVGDPMLDSTQVGPLARRDLVHELDRQVRRSVARGARVLTGGKPLAGPGCFYPPTVLTNVRPGMPAYDEETFGPVAGVMVARDAQDAVRLANHSRFGLGASIWSADLGRSEALARQLEAGVVFINDVVKSDPRLPFGGVKKSGYGRELGTYGIKEFTNVKTVVIA